MNTESKNTNWNNDLIDDENLLQECCSNILRNLDRNLSKSNTDHEKVGKLLSMRWYVTNEINPKTN